MDMFDCKVIVITIYFSTGYFRFESFYNEAANRIKKSADVIVNRMLIELESGGNVRFEEGSPSDVW
jgi:hypothetical protein